MAEQMVTCRHCKKKIPKSEAYHNDGSSVYYCSLLCLNSADQKRLNKDRKNYKSVKGTDRRICTDYIVKLYTDKGIGSARIPWDLIGSQMKNLLDEHQDWNYTTLQYVMWYMHEILEMDLLTERSNSPLDLVPYYVLEAKDYWLECQRINEQANAFEIPDKVVMKASRQKPRQRFKKITF